MYIKGIGLMIKLREKVFIFILMDLCTLVSGKMINNMDMDKKNGLMDLNMKVISKME
jgi:hypothetical protein